ncbi:hypothetical protein JCM10207_003892 [Rhodosporidiobolus poonsookiae]
MDARTPSTTSTTSTTPGSGMSAQIRDAKGLALELKGMLKRNDPWDRTVEYQRDTLRKAYLRIIFAPVPPSSTRTGTTDPSLRARPSTSTASASTANAASSSHPARQLDLLNLLWLDTTHALITSYRSRLSALDKAIAADPTAHRSRASSSRARLADPDPDFTRGDPSNPPPGPVARRKLLHAFRQFLSAEDAFWRTLCGRLAGRLDGAEAEGLRGLGIVPTQAEEEEGQGQGEEVGEEERRRRRRDALPLAHKALICYGDLARYAELYSEAPVAPSNGGGGGGEGGKGRGKGRKKGGDGQQRQGEGKTYAKAAGCYTQARLLLPDNGNPSNQLAVLSQYAHDALSSVYHYLRALATRQPFATARANLQVTLKRAVARWAAEGAGGQAEGDEKERFVAACVALHGVLFTKERLSDLPALQSLTHALFLTATRERLLTSDVVLKVVVTALAALWDARMARSSVGVGKSATGASSVAVGAGTGGGAPSSAGPSSEPHLLLHVLDLYTTLLTVSSSETNELVASLPRPSTSSTSPPANHNPHAALSAVLRRSLPALRILHRWLLAQGEYVERVAVRVEAAERRRARTSASQDEAQRAVGESEEGSQRVGGVELREKLDGLWAALADFANSMLVAFPSSSPSSSAPPADAQPQPLWLEEDVELLGFAPLRRRTAEASASAAQVRRVGRDVHPNDEQVMRVREGMRDIEGLAESPLSHFAFSDGAYVFRPRDYASQSSSLSKPARTDGAPEPVPAGEEAQDEEDTDMLDQATEDDPVDRAMRIDAADKLDMGGLESEEEEEEDDEDEEEEQIVFEGNRSSRASPSQQGSPAPSRASPAAPPPAVSPLAGAARARTADDLRQLLLAGSGPSARPSSSSALPPPAASPSPHASPFASPLAGPPLTRHPTAPAAPSLPLSPPTSSSIWAPPSGAAPAGLALFPPAPVSAAAAAPVTPRAFEALPNVVHGSPAAQAHAAAGSGWGAAPYAYTPPPAQHQRQPHQPPYPPAQPHQSPFSAPPPLAHFPPSSHSQPLPTRALPAPAPAPANGGFSTAFAGLGGGFGPFAPGAAGGAGGWPAMPPPPPPQRGQGG